MTTTTTKQTKYNNDYNLRAKEEEEKEIKHDVIVVNEWIRTESTLIDDRNICAFP